MCGRYTRSVAYKVLMEYYGLPVIDDDEFSEVRLAPNWNVTPGTAQPTIRLDVDSNRELAFMTWGLVPYWSKEPKAAFSSINARDDKLDSSGAWRIPWKRTRCLIPANGFYEWEPLTDAERKAKESKPWAVSLKDDRLFSFGGLWDRWKSKDGQTILDTFAIVTVEPNEVLEPFHNRCPLIIERKDYARWLEPGISEQPPIDLLRTYPGELMKAWQVNKLKGNGPELLAPKQ